jgi:TolB-like protein
VNPCRSARRWWPAVAGLAGLVGLAACAPAYLHSQIAPHASLPARARIAVLPVVAASVSSGEEGLSQGVQIAPGAAAVITRELYERLEQETDFQLVDRAKVEQALAASAEPPSTAAALQELARTLGAEVVLQGVVTLYRERDGSHVSISHPAAVGLGLWLIDGRDGRLLWSGRYYEVQRSLSEEVRTLSLYWKRGARWLTAEELSSYAVAELVKTLPPVRAPGGE